MCTPDAPNGIDPRNTVSLRRAKGQAVINLAIIRHHSGTIGLSDARRMLLESHIDQKGPTGRINRDTMSVSLQGDYDAARRSAVTSAEVLYYGRIFAENIDSNVEWTVNVRALERSSLTTLQKTPFPLPSCYFAHTLPSRPSSPMSVSDRADDDLRGWLKDLVWDPYHDDYSSAMRKVKWRASQRSDWSRQWAGRAGERISQRLTR